MTSTKKAGESMNLNRYAIWNSETEQDEGYEFMTKAQADSRNATLRANGEPQRIVPDFNHTPRVVPPWNAKRLA